MNRTLMDILLQQLGAQAAGAVAGRLGVDESKASRAIAAALPLILAALARNASTPGGAASLERALEKKHDGSLLDMAGAFLGGGSLDDGNAILRHVFGSRRSAVEDAVSSAAALDRAKTSDLFAMLAPLVMAYLGRERRAQGLDADDLSDLLGGALSGAPAAGAEEGAAEGDPSLLDQLAGSLLDRNRDGKTTDDALRMGTGLLGRLLRGKRG